MTLPQHSNRKIFFLISLIFVFIFIQDCQSKIKILENIKNKKIIEIKQCHVCNDKRKIIHQSLPMPLWEKLQNFTPKEEKPIVVVVPSFNNKNYYKINLESIFTQKYKNYRVIYIDDCSPDGTGDLVENYIKKNRCEDKITLIRNKKRYQSAARNIYYAVHSCNNDEIIAIVDGDDQLAHDHVLQLLNKVYSFYDIWMTYGQFIYYPSNTIGFCKEIPKAVIENNSFREYNWITSHLRSYYAWLYKNIAIEDCLYQNKFVQAAGDLAAMFPMLEMSADKSLFIPDILYVYNRENPINVDKTDNRKQSHLSKIVRKKRKYKMIIK